METPFMNDPFAMIWKVFKELYPEKDCQVWYEQHQDDDHDEEYGFTSFPDDGGTPLVFIYAEHDINIQSETLAHELAHVAVGLDHGHDEVWEAAFNAIFQGYNRLGDEMFGEPISEEAGGEHG